MADSFMPERNSETLPKDHLFIELLNNCSFNIYVKDDSEVKLYTADNKLPFIRIKWWYCKDLDNKKEDVYLKQNSYISFEYDVINIIKKRIKNKINNE